MPTLCPSKNLLPHLTPKRTPTPLPDMPLEHLLQKPVMACWVCNPLQLARSTCKVCFTVTVMYGAEHPH